MEVRLLNIKEVAEILHVSRPFVYSLLKQGELPSVRMERMLRVRPEDLERYIHEQAVKNDKKTKDERR